MFPHIVFDDFLPNEIAIKLEKDFPSLFTGDWTHYHHVNEKKFGKTNINLFPNSIAGVINELNSDKFVSFLSKLSGIKGLFADHSLNGGGIHQIEKGGHLNIHADFTVHPYNKNWKRRINLLLYLNSGWKEEWGGHIELWDKKMTYCGSKILPVLNRCLIFNTDVDSFHGNPDPLLCPKTVTRKSIALYYFTKEKKPFVRSTEYRSRTQDNSTKRAAIFLDKYLLRCYDFIKRIFNIDDKYVSRILGFFYKKKK